VLALGPNQLGSGGGGVKAWVLRRGASLEARKHTPRIGEDSPAAALIRTAPGRASSGGVPQSVCRCGPVPLVLTMYWPRPPAMPGAVIRCRLRGRVRGRRFLEFCHYVQSIGAFEDAYLSISIEILDHAPSRERPSCSMLG